MITNVTTIECTCERCGKVWIAKQQNIVPKTCANVKCRSKYWNKKRGTTDTLQLTVGC